MLAYAALWTNALIAVHLIVISLLSWQVYTRLTDWKRFLGLVLFVWLAVTVFISAGTWIQDMTIVLSPLGTVMSIAATSAVLLALYWRPMRTLVAALPLSWLMGVQVYRVMGAVFFFGWQSGEVPFALGPFTAFNDVFVGISAPLVVFLLVRRNAKRLAIAWNIFGLLDFAYAVTVGVLAAPHALQLLTLSPDTSVLAQPPLVLISLWAVPLSILLHSVSLARLMARDAIPHPKMDAQLA